MRHEEDRAKEGRGVQLLIEQYRRHQRPEDAEWDDDRGVHERTDDRRPEELILREGLDPVVEADEARALTQGVVEETQAQREQDRPSDEHHQADHPRQEEHIRPEDLLTLQRSTRRADRPDSRCCSSDH